MPILQGHKLSFLALKTYTKNLRVFTSCYGKFSIGLLCSAPDSSCVACSVLLYYLRYTAAEKVIDQNISFNVYMLGFFNFTSIKNSSYLFILPSHHSPTHSPSNMRHLSYRVPTFSAPYSYKYICCLISRPVTAVYT